MRQNYRFQLLAPSQTRSTLGTFTRSKIDEQLYSQYLASMQRLRGRIYLSDGAIQPWEIDDDGRFRMRGDKQSWHFLLIDDKEEVIGCARYLVHPNTISFDQLRVRHCALANHPLWADKVRLAIENDLQWAREHDFSYVEIGGWALSEEWRGTRAALEILVASYALSHLWGGCVGACTATVRHGSASILRRIGGSRLQALGEALPPYADPQYGCEMELLRFDSCSPSSRFVPLIAQLKSKLSGLVPIRPYARPEWTRAPGELALHTGLLLTR